MEGKKMVEITGPGTSLEEAVKQFRAARFPLAFTGAGISVPSGIPDFRSEKGLWTKYNPEMYATLDAFLEDPKKVWDIYRDRGRMLLDKKPNKAHLALAELEKSGLLKGIITQNIDRLHQFAGSSMILEIHGNFGHLQCLECGSKVPVSEKLLETRPFPVCELCGSPLKPDIVLFGESVRQMEAIQTLTASCDLLLVIGTSANVYPAAALPTQVRQNGGLLYEFNLEPVLQNADCCFSGSVVKSLPLLMQALNNNAH
jgi:NAD-dependent deacetylase